MRKLRKYITLSMMLCLLSSCIIRDDVRLNKVSILYTNVEVSKDQTTARITGKFESNTTISRMAVSVNTSANFYSPLQTIDLTIHNDSTFEGVIKNLGPRTTYYYSFHFENDLSSYDWVTANNSGEFTPDMVFSFMTDNIPTEITVADAIEICNGLSNREVTNEWYYVKGYVAKMTSSYESSIINYGNVSYIYSSTNPKL